MSSGFRNRYHNDYHNLGVSVRQGQDTDDDDDDDNHNDEINHNHSNNSNDHTIDNFEISGLKTTLDFGKYVLTHPAFCSGDFDTNFVKTYFSDTQAIYDGFTDETMALQSGINQLWEDLKASNQKQFDSHPIITNWIKVP